MHAYLFVGKPDEIMPEALIFAKTIADKNIFIEEVYKISELRQLLKNTSLSYSEPTVYLLKNFDQSSTETQNAFLKKLEEPQENLFFILTAKNEHNLIPTILSRISVKNVSREFIESTESFFALSNSEKINVLSQIKNRDDAISFLSLCLNEARENQANYKYIEALELISKRINANANTNLQLTFLLTELS